MTPYQPSDYQLALDAMEPAINFHHFDVDKYWDVLVSALTLAAQQPPTLHPAPQVTKTDDNVSKDVMSAEELACELFDRYIYGGWEAHEGIETINQYTRKLLSANQKSLRAKDEEIKQLRDVLQWYADGNHYALPNFYLSRELNEEEKKRADSYGDNKTEESSDMGTLYVETGVKAKAALNKFSGEGV